MLQNRPRFRRDVGGHGHAVGRGDGEPVPTWLSLALAILVFLHSQGLLPTLYKYLKEQNIIIHHINGR